MMIVKGIVRWLLLGGLIMVMPYFVPGLEVTTSTAALIAAAVIGLINTFIKPILKILTLPLRIITLGLFGFILNVLLFWLASLFVPGFNITTLTAGIIGAIIMAIGLWILDKLL